MHRHRPSGFTLYELMMTLALVALVLGLGLPALDRLAASQRIRGQLDPLFHAVHHARKVSIARRQVVTLCPSSDGANCEPGTDWSHGWIMFVNADRDYPVRRDAGEPLLRIHAGDPRVRITANRSAFTLRSTELRATNGTLVVCDRAGRVAPRALVVSYTGRPRVAREDPGGRPYGCRD